MSYKRCTQTERGADPASHEWFSTFLDHLDKNRTTCRKIKGSVRGKKAPLISIHERQKRFEVTSVNDAPHHLRFAQIAFRNSSSDDHYTRYARGTLLPTSETTTDLQRPMKISRRDVHCRATADTPRAWTAGGEKKTKCHFCWGQ